MIILLHVIGPNPLTIVSDGEITIEGTLDLPSKSEGDWLATSTVGSGRNSQLCAVHLPEISLSNSPAEAALVLGLKGETRWRWWLWRGFALVTDSNDIEGYGGGGGGSGGMIVMEASQVMLSIGIIARFPRRALHSWEASALG